MGPKCSECGESISVVHGRIWPGTDRPVCAACWRALEAGLAQKKVDQNAEEAERLVKTLQAATGIPRERLRVVFGEGVPPGAREAFEKAGIPEFKSMAEAFAAGHAQDANDSLDTINCLRQERDEALKRIHNLEIRLKSADLSVVHANRRAETWKRSADKLGRLAARYERERDALSDRSKIPHSLPIVSEKILKVQVWKHQTSGLSVSIGNVDPDTGEPGPVHWWVERHGVPVESLALSEWALANALYDHAGPARPKPKVSNTSPQTWAAEDSISHPVRPKPKVSYPTQDPSGKSCLDLAREAVDDRAGTYGDPLTNHGTTAEFWTTHLKARGLLKDGAALTAEDVCWLNTYQKGSRDTFVAKLDNLVDGCGYLRNVEVIRALRAKKEGK